MGLMYQTHGQFIQTTWQQDKHGQFVWLITQKHFLKFFNIYVYVYTSIYTYVCKYCYAGKSNLFKSVIKNDLK